MESLIGGGAPANGVIKDTDTAGFRADVIDASMQTPVIVDFWAPWCGPCKQLGPALERAVQAARGKVKLVKINVDQNQALAAQMRIQSIPAVWAFFQGRPIDAFVGALPDSQIKTFVERLAKQAGDGDDALQDALDHAREALAAGDFNAAGNIYGQVLQVEPGLPEAIAGFARTLLALGRRAEAEEVLNTAPPEAAKAPEVVSVVRELELMAQAGDVAADTRSLRDRLAKDPDDHQARIDLATALFAGGNRQGAIDELLEAIRRDREWNEQAARKELLKYFEALGPKDPLTLSARRRLSSLLFS
ncbi:MAG: co-chaperone YbbN [Rhodospirillaceae bacterium]|nr:co-chaperone YbbN [Rhodospirillaceae bacterium]